MTATSLRHLIRTGVLTSALVGVASCGGGGGGGDPAPPPAPSFTIAGTVTGLAGTGLKIKNAAAADQSIATNGAFTLAGSFATGTAYDVSISAQPTSPAQICVVANGKGTVNGSNVTNVAITCSLALSNSTPANGATGVERNAARVLTFSGNLDAATANPTSVSLRSANGEHPISTSVTGSQLTVTSGHNLLPLTQYTLEVRTGVRGALGEVLANPVTVDFTSADGAWKPEQPLQKDLAAPGREVQIAFGGNGNAVAAWTQSGGGSPVWASLYIAGQGWQEAQQLETLVSFSPQVAMDASGNALVMWTTEEGSDQHVFAKTRLAGETAWGELKGVDNNESHEILDLRLAVAPGGEAFAVWGESTVGVANQDVRVNRRLTDRTWTGSEPLEHTDNKAEKPSVAIDSNGNATAVWIQTEDGGSHNRILMSRYSAGGSWSTPAPIDDPTQSNAFEVQIAMDANGDAWAVWSQSDSTGEEHIWRSRATGAVWGTAEPIDHDEAAGVFVPQLAINGHGDAIVAWRRRQTVGAQVVFSAVSDVYRDGAWQGQKAISAETIDVPRVAIDASGNALLVVAVDTQRANAYRFTPGDKWSEGTTLGGSIGDVAVAVDADGNALAAWRSDDVTPVIKARRFE